MRDVFHHGGGCEPSNHAITCTHEGLITETVSAAITVSAGGLSPPTTAVTSTTVVTPTALAAE